MKLEQSILEAERSIISELKSAQAAIDDKTGKGTSTEEIIDSRILTPHLPPRFQALKGSVILRGQDKQSEAIDRIIFDRAAAPPLVYSKAHSIFTVEVVAGLVEITMHLDARKLRADMSHMKSIRALRNRRYLMPDPEHSLNSFAVEVPTMGARCYCVGLPADPNWDPDTIAQTFLSIQKENDQLVHGLYVLGIGYFATVPESNNVKAWLGDDRLFRFTDSWRTAFDRWPPVPETYSVIQSDYLSGTPKMIVLKTN